MKGFSSRSMGAIPTVLDEGRVKQDFSSRAVAKAARHLGKQRSQISRLAIPNVSFRFGNIPQFFLLIYEFLETSLTHGESLELPWEHAALTQSQGSRALLWGRFLPCPTPALCRSFPRGSAAS